ncbi:fat body protein 2-like [Contarinia nasturtii]|uniref:fat body protein 2-like n=1 Tax=Contarinia nasturtii TaxID=265458 RepID=UPI0012D43FAE|nr:fat body protein 2-like [Contarinia nasturtii]
MFSNKTITFCLTNVRDKNDLERALKLVKQNFGSIDCVVTCAGVLNEKDYRLTIEVNLLGVIHTNNIAMEYMTKEAGHNGGLIVNISSVAGIDCAQFSTPVYNATKHGVVAFTRSMGDNFFYEKSGIFITICPGVTLTTFLNDLDRKVITVEAFEYSSKKLNHVLKQTVDEFAAAFIDVLNQDKNGSVWLIDGGKFKEITFQNPWHDNRI